MKTLGRERDKNELLRRLAAMRPDAVARWGRMSPHQMICHLGDGFRMALGQKPVSPSASLVQRTVVKWIALYLPLPWPAGAPTRPEIDQSHGGTGTVPVDFVQDLAECEALLNMTTMSGTLHAPRHPIFGRMSRAAWLRWAYLHVDHHLRQFGR